MKILGVGLSKTGTSSLNQALKILGYKSLHYDQVRFKDLIYGSNPTPNFRCYDDVDAVTDLPAAYFYDELLEAYPDCKCILTIRNIDSWWRSISAHFNTRIPILASEQDSFRARLRDYVYGSSTAFEFLFKKKYREHNERVIERISSNKLLIMNITEGDGWEVLCPFLDKDVPTIAFPYLNKSPIGKEDFSHLLQLAKHEIVTTIPTKESLILVDQGYWGLNEISERHVIPFLEKDGMYWGTPADDRTAILELERLRRSGANFMVFAWPAFWWLDYYSGLHQHLDSEFRCLLKNERLIVYGLRT